MHTHTCKTFKSKPSESSEANAWHRRHHDDRVTIDTINRFGLVYTITGSDKNLAPILLTAHQDVVPVDNATQGKWEYPPFEAHYDEESGYLYGRGASDDKSAITALMSAMEALLSQEEYNPRRTTIMAFGFDEECSGYRGAEKIAEFLEKSYGEDGVAIILDEGGAGLQDLGDTMYALPAVYEKGYLDVWFDLEVLGGHSSTPTPHTSIGIMSEIVTKLEANPFHPEIEQGGPIHQALICLARYSPFARPDLTKAVYLGNLDRAARILADASVQTQYMIQTAQSINWISGGTKINSLPEHVTVGVNHRFIPQESADDLKYRAARIADSVVRKYGIEIKAFEGDEDYDNYLSTNGLSRPGASGRERWEPIYSGKLVLEGRKISEATRSSPTKGAVWDTFAGTVRHTWAERGKNVVMSPGAMTGNTDTRHYLGKSTELMRRAE